MNNIMIGDDVVNLDNMGTVRREVITRHYRGMRWVDIDPPEVRVLFSFPSGLEGEVYKSFRGPKAEAVWAFLEKHSYVLNV